MSALRYIHVCARRPFFSAFFWRGRVLLSLLCIRKRATIIMFELCCEMKLLPTSDLYDCGGTFSDRGFGLRIKVHNLFLFMEHFANIFKKTFSPNQIMRPNKGAQEIPRKHEL